MLWKTCGSNRRAVAAVEFAVTCPLLLMIMGGLADFPLAFRDQSLIETGVANGATYAFQQMQTNLALNQQISASDVQAIVQNAINLANVTVTATPPALECETVNQTTAPPTRTLVAASAGSTCADGSRPGTYVTVTASYVYKPLMPVYSRMENTKFTDTASVRVY